MDQLAEQYDFNWEFVQGSGSPYEGLSGKFNSDNLARVTVNFDLQEQLKTEIAAAVTQMFAVKKQYLNKSYFCDVILFEKVNEEDVLTTAHEPKE